MIAKEILNKKEENSNKECFLLFGKAEKDLVDGEKGAIVED